LRGARRALAIGLVLEVALPAGLAGADSFIPVRLDITVTPVARVHSPLALSVSVSADPGALDNRSGPVRVRAKLAGECGGAYQYASGAVLLDKQLGQQPSAGQAYFAVARGTGRPTTYGVETVCVWLNDAAGRTWASDQSTQVNVSRACTTAAARYDSARRKHRPRSLAARNRQRRIVAADRRAALKACGPGVPL
jgi:hypothetical protein